MIYMVRVMSAEDERRYRQQIDNGWFAELYGCDGHAIMSVHSSSRLQAPSIPRQCIIACLNVDCDEVVNAKGRINPGALEMQRVHEFVLGMERRIEKVLLIVQCEDGRNLSGSIGRHAIDVVISLRGEASNGFWREAGCSHETVTQSFLRCNPLAHLNALMQQRLFLELVLMEQQEKKMQPYVQWHMAAFISLPAAAPQEGRADRHGDIDVLELRRPQSSGF